MAKVIEDTEGLIMLIIFGGVALLMFAVAKKSGLLPTPASPSAPSPAPPSSGSSPPSGVSSSGSSVFFNPTSKWVELFKLNPDGSWNNGQGRMPLLWAAIKETWATAMGHPLGDPLNPSTPAMSPVPDSTQASTYQFVPDVTPIDATDAWSAYSQSNSNALAEWAQNNLQE